MELDLDEEIEILEPDPDKDIEVCYSCGKKESQVKLFDGILENHEIVKICENCSRYEDIPILKKPNTNQLRAAERPFSAKERLDKLSGIVWKSGGRKEEEIQEKEKFELVEDFGKKIQRAREMRGLTKKQLGELIAESEAAVDMLEKGKLPEEPELLLKKLEQYLRIEIIKRPEKKDEPKVVFEFEKKKESSPGEEKIIEEKDKEHEKKIEEIAKKGLVIDREISKSLTISDLRELQERQKAQGGEEGDLGKEIKAEDLLK